MLWLPKWLNTWLDENEEARLVDPDRRAFLGGMVATGIVLAAPKLFSFPPLEIVSSRAMRIPLQIRPGGLYSEAEIVALEIERIRHKLPVLFDVPYHRTAGLSPWLVGLERHDGRRK